MDLGLAGNVYIVSGASAGLGFATAAALASDGARLVVCSRDQARIEAAAQRLRERGAAGVTALAADVADPTTAERLCTAARQEFGQLDGAVVNVGGPPAGKVTDLADEQWRSAFESVFLGPLRLAREVLAGTAAHPVGSPGQVAVTFILSTSVRNPLAGLAASNGLRPGLAMLTKTLADEFGPVGGRVNAVLPGRMDTERSRQLDQATGDPDRARARVVAGIPLGRVGQPDELGRVAAFVTSPAASFMSGSLVTVDGGATRSI